MEILPVKVYRKLKKLYILYIMPGRKKTCTRCRDAQAVDICIFMVNFRIRKDIMEGTTENEKNGSNSLIVNGWICYVYTGSRKS